MKEKLGGIYIDVNANLIDNALFHGYTDVKTRFSPQIDSRNSESKIQIAKHWELDTLYQYENLEKRKNIIAFKNAFKFGNMFG